MNIGGFFFFFFFNYPGWGINEEVKNQDKRKHEDNELGNVFNNFRTKSHVRIVHKYPQLACDILCC
jgi:hypothetical protein